MRHFIKSKNASCLASNHWNAKRQADLRNGRTSRIARLYLQTRLGLETLIAGLRGALFTRQPMPAGVSSEPVTVSGDPRDMSHCRGMTHRRPHFASLAR